MIDNKTVISLRVQARFERLTAYNLPRGENFDPENFFKNYKGARNLYTRKLREFEIKCQPPIGKVLLAEHHIRDIHRNIENRLQRAPLNGELEFWQDIRSVCSEIEDYPNQILNRLAPVFSAFDSLDPNHQLRREFGSVTKKFKAQVEKIRNDIPGGKGVYQKRFRQLAPVGEKYLRECFNITDKLIREAFKSKSQ